MLLAMSLNIKEFTPVPNFIGAVPKVVALVHAVISPVTPTPSIPELSI